MLLAAWRVATRLSAPLVRRYLAKRLEGGREHATRWPERLGYDSSIRPTGPLVWLHAVSVGEALSILPLVEGLQKRWPTTALLVTTGTVASAVFMEQRLPKDVLHRFAPVDLPDVVDRFLDRWRPDLVLFVESELWPNTIGALERRNVPLVLVNGRLGLSAFRRWRWAKPVARRLLRPVKLVLAQSHVDAERFGLLGAANVRLPGNLKHAAPPLPADRDELATVQGQIGRRPVWLAASTHQGEEQIVGRIHRALLADFPDLLTIITPRQPRRGEEIVTALKEIEVLAVRRTIMPAIPDHGLYVADTMGELGLFYQACKLAFMGGSLVRHGGQNPLEAAKLGCAILFGPHIWNFEEIAEGLRQAQGAKTVLNEAALMAQVRDLLSEPERMEFMGKAAQAYAEEHVGVLPRSLDALAPLMPTAT